MMIIETGHFCLVGRSSFNLSPTKRKMHPEYLFPHRKNLVCNNQSSTSLAIVMETEYSRGYFVLSDDLQETINSIHSNEE